MPRDRRQRGAYHSCPRSVTPQPCNYCVVLKAATSSQDCAELICMGLGSDLGRFACVSTAMNRVVADNPTVWRETYQARCLALTVTAHRQGPSCLTPPLCTPVLQARFDDVEGEWGADACPPSLWRGCLLKESGPKQM